MNQILKIFTLLLFLSSCAEQKKEIAINSIVLKAKESSLYSDKVNWEKVNKKFIELTKDKEKENIKKDYST